MATQLEAPDQIPAQAHYAIALALRRMLPSRVRYGQVRAYALSTVSSNTLLNQLILPRFDFDQKRAAERAQQDYVHRQTAIIVAGLALGFVVQNKNGKLEVR